MPRLHIRDPNLPPLATMTREAVVDEVRALLSDYTGRRIEDIHETSELYPDLGIAGDDGYDLIVLLAKRYGADFQGIDLGAYFGDEAGCFPALIFWPVLYCFRFYFGRPDDDSGDPKGSITIATLVDRILAAGAAKPATDPAISDVPPGP